jgi:hypothetical protein
MRDLRSAQSQLLITCVLLAGLAMACNEDLGQDLRVPTCQADTCDDPTQRDTQANDEVCCVWIDYHGTLNTFGAWGYPLNPVPAAQVCERLTGYGAGVSAAVLTDRHGCSDKPQLTEHECSVLGETVSVACAAGAQGPQTKEAYIRSQDARCSRHVLVDNDSVIALPRPGDATPLIHVKPKLSWSETLTDLRAALKGCTSIAEPPRGPLSVLRHRLFNGMAQGDVCRRWNDLERSRKAVFLTLSDRLFKSMTPDGLSMLHHSTALHVILGGGKHGSSCGGLENNRLFLSMDRYLWKRMVGTWSGGATIGDGGKGTWEHTHDLAGPHHPFDASNETATGLECLGLFELSASRSPTAQAHFFREGSAVRVKRGSSVDLSADPYMLEIDLDFNCWHLSNPLCPGKDFTKRYVDNYGDFACDWVPRGCTPATNGCYRNTL